MNTHRILSCGWLVVAAVTSLVSSCCVDPDEQRWKNVETRTAAVIDRPIEVGDIILVEWHGQQTMNPYSCVVSTGGKIALPSLDKEVAAIGKRPRELETNISELYTKAGVFVDPNVKVTLG